MTVTLKMSRADRMRERMADPVQRAKALANLQKGQVALAAKRAAKKAAQSAPTVTEDPPRPKAPGAPTESASTRRAVGVGRWRGI